MAKIEDAAGKSGLFTDGDWILSENMIPNGTIGIIQLKHIGVGEFQDKEFQFISNDTFDELGCTEVLPGDVLISRMADPIGRTCIVPRLPFRSVTAVDVSILRVDESVADSRFITHLCNSQLVRNRIARAARGTTRSRITRTELGETEIPLPPLPEQRQIAARLEEADRLRHTRRYALELTDAFLPVAFRQFFGPQLKAGPFRAFGELVKITGGGTPAREHPEFYKGRIPWLTSKDMKGDYIWDTEEHITEKAIQASATNLVPAGSILVVVKSKVLMHRLPIAIAKVPLCHGQDIKSIQCSETLHPEFARFILKFHEGRLLNLARGANTEGLTLPMLEELPVPTVPLSEQERFATLVTRHERLRAVQREALRQAEHLFASLLQRAFSG